MFKRLIRAASEKRRVFVPVILVLLTLVVLTGSFSRATAFIQRPLTQIGTNIFRWAYFSFGSPNLTTEELQKLISERDLYALGFADISKLEDENAELRSLLGFHERIDDDLIPASIISRNSIAEIDRFLIDVGSNDGAREGLPVIVGDGIFIGKITSTTPESSTVTGVLHSESATAVSLLNENRTIGLVEGQDTNLLNMLYIPQDEDIEVNDLVVTSGLEEGIPGGLLVGIVNAIQSEPQNPFKQAVVEPMTDSRRHTLVFVIKDETL